MGIRQHGNVWGFFINNTDTSPLVISLYPSHCHQIFLKFTTAQTTVVVAAVIVVHSFMCVCMAANSYHLFFKGKSNEHGWAGFDATLYWIISGIEYWYQSLKCMYSGDVLWDERAAIICQVICQVDVFASALVWFIICLRCHLVLEPFMEAPHTEHDKHGGFVYRHTRHSHTLRQWLEDMSPSDGGGGTGGGKKKRKNGGQGEVPLLLF